MKELQEIVSDDEIEIAFTNTNFGNTTKRDLIKYGLLKYASGYSTGHTLYQILNELGFLLKSKNLTKKGKRYLYCAFYNGNSF